MRKLKYKGFHNDALGIIKREGGLHGLTGHLKMNILNTVLGYQTCRTCKQNKNMSQH